MTGMNSLFMCMVQLPGGKHYTHKFVHRQNNIW